MSKKPKRPRDPNQLAKLIVDVATGELVLPEDQPDGKNSAAVALGKLGGLKGGRARAERLSKAQRTLIAKNAAAARWNRVTDSRAFRDPSCPAPNTTSDTGQSLSLPPEPIVGIVHGTDCPSEESTDAGITAEYLRLRRQELASVLAAETDRAEAIARELWRHRLSAERFQARIDEIDALLARIGQAHTTETALPLRQPPESDSRTKPSLRYRTQCATTDIVALAYATPGIDCEQLITTVYEKYKEQGTNRDTISKMVNRLLREKYASRRRGKLFLEDVCKRAWEASPHFLAS